MSLSLMRFMVKADAKLGFVPYDTLLNKKLEVSYRSIEAAFRRCDSLNQVSAGGTARAQQAQPSVDGKAPATRLLNVYNRIHELYSRICTSVDGLSVFRAHRSEYDGLLDEYVQLAAAQVVNRANPSPYWGHDRFTVSGEGFSMVCADSTPSGHPVRSHLARHSTAIWPPVPRPSGRAVGAQRRRGCIVSLRRSVSSISSSVCASIPPSD